MELLLIGAVGFLLASQLLKWATPYYLKTRLSGAVKGQSVGFYRKQLKAHRRLIQLRRVENRTKEMLITGVMMGVLFMTAPLLLAPYPTLSALIIGAGLLEFQFYGKHWKMRRLPLYTFFSVEEEPKLFSNILNEESKEPIYKRKLQLADRRMVRTKVLKEFVLAKKLAKDLEELDASVQNADEVIKEMASAGVDATEVEAVRQQAVSLSESIAERLTAYPELLLHLLDASGMEFKQAKEKEEAGELATANMLKAMSKLSDVEETPFLAIVRNPAVEDMVRIIESKELSSETRAYAEKTLKEIQERMNQEAEEKEEHEVLSNALTSIETARKFYLLDA